MSAASMPSPLVGRVPRLLLKLRAAALGHPELLLVLLVAAVLNLWALDRNEFANTYYSAAVRSMTTSWHAFLFGSFDPAGVMTLDKPPLAFWVQAASARVFGFSSWGLLLPQALMGVATVGLVYDLTRRRFGRHAGLAAGLVMALTPAAVAISRHNNPDALLMLCITAAVWAVVRGLEDGRTRWLVLSGVCVGLGFEAKMGAALLVVPALGAAWLWVAPKGRLTALRQLLCGGAAMAATSLAWPLLMWLTPAADRPWIAGTSDNSIWSLIFGYNGFGRLLGQAGGPGGGGPGGGDGGGGNTLFGGEPGFFRLLNQALGGQAGWLLGFALVSGVAVVAISRLHRDDARTGWVIAVGGAFAVTALAFSKAEGIFHPYYVSALAPFTAALAGAGVGALSDRGLAARVLGPLAVAGGIAAEVTILEDHPGQLGAVPGLLVAVGAGAAFVLATSFAPGLRRAALAVALGALLIAPAIWSVETLGHAASGTFPTGGPAAAGMGGGPRGGPPAFGGGPAAGRGGGRAGFGGNTQSLAQAVAYAKAHGGGTIAVSSQTGAAGELISSGADVAGIGGFSGRESQVSSSWLADAVAAGKIRWVITNGGGLRFDGRTGADDVMAVAQRVGTSVRSIPGLYDLQGKAGALRAAAVVQ